MSLCTFEKEREGSDKRHKLEMDVAEVRVCATVGDPLMRKRSELTKLPSPSGY